MIKFLSTWIGQIAISVIIVSIFEMILPSGNLKKYIKVVLGVYIIYCMISPFVNNKKLFDLEDINLDKYLENTASQSTVSQESMDKRLEQLYIEELKKNIEAKVNENGYEIIKCKIDATLNNKNSNAGIHNINLVIKEKQNSNIEIDKIEIGNTLEMEKSNETSEGIEEIIANYLEINKDTVSVKIKS